ncbi:MAG: energy transducer TonB [Planctomycetota bacterium]
MAPSPNARLRRPVLLSLTVHLGACAAVVLAHWHTHDPGRTPSLPIKILPQQARLPATPPCPRPEVLPESVEPVPLIDTSASDTSASDTATADAVAAEPQAPAKPEPESVHPSRPQPVLPDRSWASKRLLAKRSEELDTAAEPTRAATARPAPAAPVPAPPPTERAVEAAAAADAIAIAIARVPTVVPGTNVPPKYPRIARRRRYEGTVLLRIHCNARGHVTSVVVASSSGHRCLDEAATTAVRRWRFEHGPGAIEQPIHFQLRAAGLEP